MTAVDLPTPANPGDPDADVSAAPGGPDATAVSPAGSSAVKPRPRLTQLDGVRGIAMLIVFAYHCGLGWAKGGLLAVDVFFVLSGFLITGLLLSENARTGTIAFGRFWGRRAVRLLPAMLIMLTVVMLVWRATAPAASLPGVRSDVIGALLYIANWHFALAGANYFTHGLTPSPMLHMWSLAVEEQFYLLWPLIFWAATRRRTQQGAIKAIRTVSTVGLLASSALMAGLSLHGVSPSRLYYGTDTRATALLTGALLATLVPLTPKVPDNARSARRARFRAVALGTWGALAAIGLGYFMHTADGEAHWLYRGGFLLVAFLAASIIAGSVAAPNGPLAIALRFPPLRALGRVSYGAYLWHWPVILFLTHARTGLSGNELLLLRIAVTVVLAVLSWNLVEQPLQRAFNPKSANSRNTDGSTHVSKPRLRHHKPAWVGLTAMLGILSLAAITAAAPAHVTPGDGIPTALSNLQAGDQLKIPTQRAVPSRQGASPPLQVNFYGDSIAWALAINLSFDTHGVLRRGPTSTQARFNMLLGGDTILGCGVMGDSTRTVLGVTSRPGKGQGGYCGGWDTSWTQNVDKQRPNISIMLVGRWETVNREWDGAMHNVLDGSGYAQHVVDQLKKGIAIAGKDGALVALIDMPCIQDPEAPDGSTYPEDDPHRIAKYNQLLAQAAAESAVPTRIYSIDSILCENGHNRATDAQGRALRVADGVHPTMIGAQEVANYLFPQLIDWYRSIHPEWKSGVKPVSTSADPAAGGDTDP